MKNTQKQFGENEHQSMSEWFFEGRFVYEEGGETVPKTVVKKGESSEKKEKKDEDPNKKDAEIVKVEAQTVVKKTKENVESDKKQKKLQEQVIQTAATKANEAANKVAKAQERVEQGKVHFTTMPLVFATLLQKKIITIDDLENHKKFKNKIEGKVANLESESAKVEAFLEILMKIEGGDNKEWETWLDKNWDQMVNNALKINKGIESNGDAWYEKAFGNLGTYYQENPIAAWTLTVLGGYGVYSVCTGGMSGKTASILGGTFLLGRLAGNEEVRKYLDKTPFSAVVNNRVTQALSKATLLDFDGAGEVIVKGSKYEREYRKTYKEIHKTYATEWFAVGSENKLINKKNALAMFDRMGYKQCNDFLQYYKNNNNPKESYAQAHTINFKPFSSLTETAELALEKRLYLKLNNANITEVTGERTLSQVLQDLDQKRTQY